MPIEELPHYRLTPESCATISGHSYSLCFDLDSAEQAVAAQLLRVLSLPQSSVVCGLCYPLYLDLGHVDQAVAALLVHVHAVAKLSVVCGPFVIGVWVDIFRSSSNPTTP